ncbi:unnamed protein product [Coregonus sp. 'balchen']|nr:unnamed protein product [Coregonus sp. 'balchen']
MLLPENETGYVWTELLDTGNLTASDGEEDHGGPEEVIVPVIFGCIFFLGVVGNTVVMIVIGKIKSRRNRSYHILPT